MLCVTPTSTRPSASGADVESQDTPNDGHWAGSSQLNLTVKARLVRWNPKNFGHFRIIFLSLNIWWWFDFFGVRGMYCTDFNLANLELLRFVSWRIYLLKIVIFRIFHGFLYVSQRANPINHHLGQKRRGFPAHFSPSRSSPWGSPAPIPKGCSPAPESFSLGAGRWRLFWGTRWGKKHGIFGRFSIDFDGDSMGILWEISRKWRFSIDFRYSWCEICENGCLEPKTNFSSGKFWVRLGEFDVKLDPFPGIIPATMKRRFEHGQNLCEWACVWYINICFAHQYELPPGCKHE